MERYYSYLKLMIIFCFSLSIWGCVASDSRVQYRWNVIHQKQYEVSGQVLGGKGLPVKNCQIYLIQRNFSVKNKGNMDLDSQILKVRHIVDTDNEGQYYFTFEPVNGSNDIWISFLDPQNVFEYKSVCINNELGDTILQYPGNNPVIKNVVLDKVGI